MQRDLFSPEASAAGPTAGLFADVVFDRPLDHAFTYAVGDELRGASPSASASARRSAAATRRPSATASASARRRRQRPVKELVGVLDDEPLLTDNLLRLTRWMADYYLCGWGQVLNAVVPAGARDKAGTRTRTFVEAVPEARRPPGRR